MFVSWQQEFGEGTWTARKQYCCYAIVHAGQWIHALQGSYGRSLGICKR
jgi:hypothetical protein